MSYACGYIVYGYAVSDNADVIDKIEEDENISDERYGKIAEFAQRPYNGGCDGFGYVGKVIKLVDECSNYNMSDIVNFEVTPELDAEIDEMLELLPDYVTDVLGERGVWLTWGSS